MTFTNEEGEQEKDDLTYNRQDFWATTSNKQLNFVQHIRTMLKPQAKLRLLCRIMFCSRAARVKSFAKNCWKQPICIQSCEV